MVMLNSEILTAPTDYLPSELRPLYPFTSHFLTLPAGRLHYLDEGPRDAPVLVMLHGNPTWSFYYRHLIVALRSEYRIIVPDHMGCGLSDKPASYPYNWPTHTENFAKLINHLGLPSLTLIAHDWGGLIGLRYAVEHPEKIAKIVLFNTAGFPIRVPRRITLLRFNFMGAVLVRWFNVFINAGFLFATHRHSQFNRLVKMAYRLPYNSPDRRNAILHFIHDIPLEKDHPQRPLIEELAEKLSTLHCPIRLFWGMRDFCFTPAVLEMWRQYVPHAEVTELPKAGHWVVEDAHEEIIPLLRDFLSDEKY